MRVWGVQFWNFRRDERPGYYFEWQTFRGRWLVRCDALRLILAEHPHVAILLDQDDLKLWIGGKLNPVIAMRSWHELSLPQVRLRAIPPGKIFLLLNYFVVSTTRTSQFSALHVFGARYATLP